jgi:hypothetical protein
MKRPKRAEIIFPNKPKSLDRYSQSDRLNNAAEKASYVASDYHCAGPSGRPAARVRSTMHCPRDWSVREALNALRQAIRSGHVSKAWIGEFPRFVWHREGDVWYEARTENGTPGRYHAHPIEVTALPAGLKNGR